MSELASEPVDISSPGSVRLRPVTEEDLEALEEMFLDPEAIGVFNWSGYQGQRVWRKRWDENRLLGPESWMLIVETPAGERAGFLSWRPVHPDSPYQCWEFGISLWPRWRGRGLGTDAQRQLVRYLFANTQYNRVQAFTSVDNIAEQRALEKAGLTREGLLRGMCFRDGTWHDEVVYGVVRSDLPPS
ncbi:MAG: GNAT family N-acetyltransferase [Labedaea sp.]